MNHLRKTNKRLITASILKILSMVGWGLIIGITVFKLKKYGYKISSSNIKLLIKNNQALFVPLCVFGFLISSFDLIYSVFVCYATIRYGSIPTIALVFSGVFLLAILYIVGVFLLKKDLKERIKKRDPSRF